MRVLIVATGARDSVSETAAERLPAFLLSLVDRPFIQHVVEYIADAGIAEKVDIVLSHMPEKVESLLGDGTRWGLRFQYHLTREATRPYGAMSSLHSTGEPVLLVHADSLPQAPIADYKSAGSTVAFCSGGKWAGWAMVPPNTQAAIRSDWVREQVENWLMEPTGVRHDCLAVLGVRSEAELIASQRAALEKRFANLMLYGREVQEGVWIGRNVSLHPTATVVPPVYLGENSRISAGVRVGPNVAVVRDCLLDRGTALADSLILPGSYVGQQLELDHVIVDRNRLINVKAGGEIAVRDDFILSAIVPGSLRAVLIGLLSRSAALLLLAVTWPALLLTAIGLYCFRRGPVQRPIRVLRLSARDDHWGWKTFELHSFASADSKPGALEHFLLCFLPGLINVVRGQLHLVGVPPRTQQQAMELPGDWRTLYLRARAGLVTEAFTIYGYDASPEEIYSCEAYYSVAAGPRHDMAILLRYIKRIFVPRRSAGTSRAYAVSLNLK